MTPDQFSEFRHTAVHELMRLNEHCKEEFQIASWPRWDYDLDSGTLTFSENSVPKVIASIQVVGTTSRSLGTWMWGWANDSLPPNAVEAMASVREFGRNENISELIKSELPDDEYLGWGMTAVAAKLLGARGAYWCPNDDGFTYLIYTSIGFAQGDSSISGDHQLVECSDHTKGFATCLCEHLLANPAQQWFSNEPDEEEAWPDAWCASCEALFLEQGEWNEKNQPKREIRMVCHLCYENLRSQGTKSD
jgi:hypothetical protein